MIRIFKTAITISSPRVAQGLLTPPEFVVDDGVGHALPKKYIHGICDWCGREEIIDLVPNEREQLIPDVPNIADQTAGRRLLAKHLNWRTTRDWEGPTYCSRKCRAAHDAHGR